MFLLVENLASELVRLGATKLIQELLEAQVTEALGRAPYERRWRRRCATGRGARSRRSG